MLTLETPRLLLRPAARTDLDAVQTWAADAQTLKYLPWGPNSRQETWDFLVECEAAAREKPRLHYDFTVLLKETGRIIGSCGLSLEEGGTVASPGWILSRGLHGLGLGTELARALVDFGFGLPGVSCVRACCREDNIASARVMEKAGLRREPESPEAGGEQTVIRYSALRDEYC